MMNEEYVEYDERYRVYKSGVVYDKLKNKNLLLYGSSHGYNRYFIHGKFQYVHRILAICFIPNPNNYPHINHINSIRNDNRLENLEWCTAKMNINHAKKMGRMKHIIGKNNPRCRKVCQYDQNNELIDTYDSLQEAQLMTGIKYQYISMACRGVVAMAKGYIFKYFENNP